MTGRKERQLISYIAPGAPARRSPAKGTEAFLRPEIGFTPECYRDALDIDFGTHWHIDPAYRRNTIISIGHELERRFGDSNIGWVQNPDAATEILS
jgi:hypothetical protein